MAVLGGQAVTDFPKHNDIRVLPHDVPQGFVKGDVDFGVDRALGDALDDVFHWLFSCDNRTSESGTLEDFADKTSTTPTGCAVPRTVSPVHVLRTNAEPRQAGGSIGHQNHSPHSACGAAMLGHSDQMFRNLATGSSPALPYDWRQSESRRQQHGRWGIYGKTRHRVSGSEVQSSHVGVPRHGWYHPSSPTVAP